jgi:hypothetical protein
MAFNVFATATSAIPLADLDANFTAIGTSAVASTLYPTATTSITYGAGATNHIFNTSGNVGIGTSSPASKLTVASTGSSIELKQNSAGSATYYVMDNTIESGGKRWRFGYSGAAGIPCFSLYNQTDDVLSLVADASGNLGLGVTPSAWNSSSKALQTSFGAFYQHNTAEVGIVANSFRAASGFTYQTTSFAGIFRFTSGEWQWFNAPSGTAGNTVTYTQAMTLNSSGNLLVGCTSAPSSSVSGVIVKPTGVEISAGSGTGLTYLMAFINGNGTVGNINVNGSTTAYATSSDYRLKNTIAPMTGALAKVALLKPVTYKWNSDGSNGEGFIAHELAEVVPECVTGEKDAVDKDGKPIYQGIDTSFLVATLTAAIQELKAEVDALKSQLNQGI